MKRENKVDGLMKCLNLTKGEFNFYLADQSRDDYFAILCHIRDRRLEEYKPSLNEFLSSCKKIGVARACNQHFFSGLTEMEINIFNRHYDSRKLSETELFAIVKDSLINPLQLVL
ncbi:hypothetical protein [Enterococcus sp. JM9B]|uniref:hypothetical protein n=1 Tax=Enterococcus sp. JM9B TaxID=1857216 RepID=UPI001374ABDF|nr:hypothetical protein [Enterococcus sp. JM9B]KAF1304846.1 hypothetical protein BAU16_01355 [Enterococcus sp. JM9B]